MEEREIIMETTALKPLRIHFQEFLESIGADYQCEDEEDVINYSIIGRYVIANLQ
ncbi:MAG: hypothetical protein LUH50_06000 [Bacteroides intestinalis]|mgnify:FL=1|jgi:hypothetical protein|uniref:hypothetical protein n=1 Tax=Bacteroides TaxID=816 RepID=UPI00131491B4|nr:MULTISPECIES: hypothetical protein [Bacteroides]MCD7939660.1 hypothetical protein [Bacteroides intestinalis]